MKKLAFITTFFIALTFVWGFKSKMIQSNTPEGIDFFNGTWEQALAKAKNEKKLIFLDAYASWCGPCKAMKRKTFTDSKVGEHFNRYYISIAVDMEKGEGPMLARKYGVDSYPTLIFLQPDGKFIGKAVGYHSPTELLNVLKQLLGL